MQTIRNVVPIIVSEKLDETREFYRDHFDVKIVFDAGWYVAFRTKGDPASEFAFRVPREGDAAFTGGIALSLQVDDVDAEFKRLSAAGVEMKEEPSDKPWGDRSFLAIDPNGIGLYIFQPIEISPEFAEFVKE